MSALIRRSSAPGRSQFKISSIRTLFAAILVVTGHSATAAESTAIEEIVVTAQKREQSLQDVPISVSVIGGDKIDRLALDTFEDLDEHVPNLVISDSPGNNQVYVRGIGTESGSLALEQSVALFVDDIYGGRARQFMEPFLDVERIEVLKGPQGALVGKNTSAGAINVISRMPTDEFELSIKGGYEFEYDSFTTTAIISGPLSDTFRGRLVAKYDDVGGYVENTLQDRDEAKGDRSLIRGIGVWDVSDTFSATGKIEYAKTDMDGHPFVTAQLGESYDYERATTFDDYDEQETLNASISLDFDIGEFVLRSITGYTDLESENFVDSDFSAPPLLGSSFFDDMKQFSQEFRLISPGTERLNYVVGLFYLNRDTDIFRQTYWNLGPFTGISNREFEEKSEVVSLYGQFDYALTDTFSLIASLRYTSEDKEGSLNRFNDGLVPPSQLDTSIEDDFTDDEVDGAIGVQWRPADSTMLYVTYTQGSKSGGFAGASSGVTEDAFTFDPESSESFELGAKFNLLENRLYLGVAAFFSTFEDLQTASYNGVSFDFANAAEAETKGLEIDSTWVINDTWSLVGSLAFLDAEFTDYPGGPCIWPDVQDPACDTQDLSGTPLPFAPDWSGSLDLYFDQSIGRLNLRANLGAAFRDDTYTHPNLMPDGVQESYVKWDARIELADDNSGWSVALLGKNLGNEKVFAQSFLTPVIPNSVTRLVDIRRTIALEASYRIGGR